MTNDISKEGSVYVTRESKESGAEKMATSMGDCREAGEDAVYKSGSDERCVESSLIDKALYAE